MRCIILRYVPTYNSLRRSRDCTARYRWTQKSSPRVTSKMMKPAAPCYSPHIATAATRDKAREKAAAFTREEGRIRLEDVWGRKGRDIWHRRRKRRRGWSAEGTWQPNYTRRQHAASPSWPEDCCHKFLMAVYSHSDFNSITRKECKNFALYKVLSCKKFTNVCHITGRSRCIIVIGCKFTFICCVLLHRAQRIVY